MTMKGGIAMNLTPAIQPKPHKRPSRERRAGRRDRRVLEGTMKYQGDFIPVEVIDLSEHGAYVLAPIMPELCDIVTINIGLAGIGNSVMISGRVRRVALGSRVMSRPGGFGIQFTRFYTRVGRHALKDHLVA
jgi:hypothetical protein